MHTPTTTRALSLSLLLNAGCAPTLLVANISNPTKTTDKTTVTQSYEIGPYKENHRYELTLSDFTTTSVGLTAKFADIDGCASPKRYSFTLVDDHGVRAPLQSSSEPTQRTEPGRAGKQLTVGTMAGTFTGAIGTTKYLVVEMRPLPGMSCPALDFKWVLD